MTISIFLSTCFCWLAIHIATNLSQGNGIWRTSIAVALWLLSLTVVRFSEFTLFQYLLLTGFIVYIVAKKPAELHVAYWVVALSVVPYLLIFPINLTKAIQHQAYLRGMFPMESLVERLRKPPIVLPEALMGFEVEGNLKDIEQLLEQTPYRDANRSEAIAWIHNGTVLDFLDREGSYGRRVAEPMEKEINEGLEARVSPKSQEGRAFTLPNDKIAKPRRPSDSEKGPLAHLHGTAIADFSFPGGFGYIKDRDHVAGFASHRFGGVAEKLKSWKIVHVELVSLLRHDRPVVYPSEQLPSLDPIEGIPPAPGRPLDAFESESLERIKKGADFIVVDVPQGLRMVGSIRNARQCIQCHQGKRGDLLGAFTYSIEVAAENR